MKRSLQKYFLCTALLGFSGLAHATNECVAQDTIRGGAEYFGVTLTQCQSICKQFYISASSEARVYDCRYVTATNDVVVLKGRPPIPHGECVAQDTIRGGAEYFNQSRDNCVNICSDFMSTAQPQAKVYDCRMIYPNGQEEVILKGRDPLTSQSR